MGEKRAKRPRGSVAPSRSPAIGGILVARTAGISAETSVTPKPTRSPSTTPVRRELGRGRGEAEAGRVEERVDARRRSGGRGRCR